MEVGRSGRRSRGGKGRQRVEERERHPAQTTTHPLERFFSLGAGARTARIASSNTFLRPFCVSAEHSRYLISPPHNHNQHSSLRAISKEAKRTEPLQYPSPWPPPVGRQWDSSASRATCQSCRDPRANPIWCPRGGGECLARGDRFRGTTARRGEEGGGGGESATAEFTGLV